MVEPHFGRHITPRWKDYVQDRRNNFSLFLDSLIEDREIIENRYDLEFENPSVVTPIAHAAHYAQEALSGWILDLNEHACLRADQAIWFGVTGLLGVYRTVAGNRIVEARISLECCTEKKEITKKRQRHEEARRYYRNARDLDHLSPETPSIDDIKSADRKLDQYLLAIEAADKAFC